MGEGQDGVGGMLTVSQKLSDCSGVVVHVALRISLPGGIQKETMILFSNNLDEKKRRHYAAIEAEKLDHGGIVYITRLFISVRATTPLSPGLTHTIFKNLIPSLS